MTANLVKKAQVCKTVFVVVLSFGDYFPPNFRSDFLFGRDAYFFGAYRWAFYTHVISGPATLLFGLVLVSETFRRRYSRWHRRLGRVQVACVLLLVTPSGLWMARYSATGAIAGAGFATLAVVTAGCVMFGWRSAIDRHFEKHRIWMLRCFVLLCSAVVLRLIGGAAEMLDVEGAYPVAAWTSWLIPLLIVEVHRIGFRVTSGNSQHGT